MSLDQNAGQSHNIKTDNSSFGRVQQCKCLATAITDRTSVQEEIKERTEVRRCLVSFGAEWFVFQCAIQTVTIKTHRNVTLPVVLYGCETWSLTLREERRLRVFENAVLRKIFVPKRDEVTGELRKLHNEEINDLYSSPNIVRVIKLRRMRWARHVARMGRGE